MSSLVQVCLCREAGSGVFCIINQSQGQSCGRSTSCHEAGAGKSL